MQKDAVLLMKSRFRAIPAVSCHFFCSFFKNLNRAGMHPSEEEAKIFAIVIFEALVGQICLTIISHVKN